MADFTSNRNILQPTVGGDSGTWGGLLNSGVAAQLDLILGATQAITVTVANVTLSIPQWNNAAINVTGALTGNRSLILPFNVNSPTVAVGGLFVVANNTTGAFDLTVLTQAAGSTGVIVPQGTRALLYSDTVNVWNADDSKVQLIPYSGNPNGFVAGTAAAVNKVCSAVWDYTNEVLYFCTVSGNAATAVWVNIVATGLPNFPMPAPEGYLSTSPTLPVITSDSIGATAIFYVAYQGNWAVYHDGTELVSFQFPTSMSLVLSASQAALNIYDVFLAYNSGTPVIGTGPSWAAGSGGSVTPGSCARGTGVGSTSLTRTSGLYTNTVSMSLIYNVGAGNVTITVPAGRGVYLGSIYIDATPGQVTCHRSFGQSRKWGISNAFNRTPIALSEGDPSSGWTYNTNTWRSANNLATNVAQAFCGLAEETIEVSVDQSVTLTTNPGCGGNIGVGVNSTTAPTGKIGSFIQGGGSNPNGQTGDMHGVYAVPPALGVTNLYFLERGQGFANSTFNGTNTNMVMTVVYNG